MLQNKHGRRGVADSSMSHKHAPRNRVHQPSTGVHARPVICSAAARPGQAAMSHMPSSTDVESAIMSAALAVGQTPSEAAHRELVQKLRDNWYNSAGDVADMSMLEVQQMQIPVRLWAQLKRMLQTEQAEEAPPEDGPLGAMDEAAGGSANLQEQQQLDASPVSGDPFQSAVSALATTSALDQGLAHGFMESLPEDLMQRRMPRNIHGASAQPVAKVLSRQRSLRSTQPYGLKEAEMSPQLHAEFLQFQHFSCSRFAGQRVEPLKPVSFTAYQDALKLMLGWQRDFKGVPAEQLNLSGLLPSPRREAVSLLMEYQQWRERERGCNARSAVFPIRACIALARFLYHDLSKPTYYDKLPPYHDLDVVKECARLQRTANSAASKAPLVTDEKKKWLEWDEYLGVVRALRAECAGLTAGGAVRPPKEVAASLQRYLIFAILSVIPDRQRTLRELEVGRTLVKDPEGRWLIMHGPDDYKTGKKYGERPPMVIAPFIYPELEAFIGTWRQALRPQHSCLFSRPVTGGPMTKPNDLRAIFVAAARRLTGRATNPHLVRDMIVTTLRNQGANEGMMDGLALFMGHSVREQRSTYDRRTKAQKVAPAMELLQGLNTLEWS